ncbi:MFS general substrate transporter [Durotheca rogersii]|uniref:MFS general substrate transporter n=1 Tax=Durotheca rogersii TaxID=419775 RepID=UPI00221E58D4|nr:MFS general substrate transporter [Durotheca rogersii]KAI5860662.1 MFS general substrate transporter [Durotheca rogersii]
MEKFAQPVSQQSPVGDGPDSTDVEKSQLDLSAGKDPSIFMAQETQDYEPPFEKTNGSSGQVMLLRDETYPEGGPEAWLVVLGAWCGLLASLGLMNTIATFQTYIATHQLTSYDEGTIGWIFSLYTALCFLCGVYIGPLFDKYGPKWLIAPGGVCVVASVMLMSICTEYWHFMLCWGILNGAATSLLFTPCITAVGHFFRERRGLASGITSTGGGLGGVVFPLMLQSLFGKVGWGWAVRILGFVCLCLLIFANLLVRKRLPPAHNASPHPDFLILKEKGFLLLTVAVFFLEFGLFIPLAYISSYALANGFDESFAFQILPILNAASVVGRAVPGWWADIIGPFNSNMISICITVFACYAVWLPFGHTTPGLVVFAIMFGFATGNNISITPVCVGKLCHTQQYGRYYATCYTIVSIACLISLPVAGAIVQATDGKYWALITFTGITQIISVITMYASKATRVGWMPGSKF